MVDESRMSLAERFASRRTHPNSFSAASTRVTETAAFDMLNSRLARNTDVWQYQSRPRTEAATDAHPAFYSGPNRSEFGIDSIGLQAAREHHTRVDSATTAVFDPTASRCACLFQLCRLALTVKKNGFNLLMQEIQLLCGWGGLCSQGGSSAE